MIDFIIAAIALVMVWRLINRVERLINCTEATLSAINGVERTIEESCSHIEQTIGKSRQDAVRAFNPPDRHG